MWILESEGEFLQGTRVISDAGMNRTLTSTDRQTIMATTWQAVSLWKSQERRRQVLTARSGPSINRCQWLMPLITKPFHESILSLKSAQSRLVPGSVLAKSPSANAHDSCSLKFILDQKSQSRTRRQRAVQSLMASMCCKTAQWSSRASSTTLSQENTRMTSSEWGKEEGPWLG